MFNNSNEKPKLLILHESREHSIWEQNFDSNDFWISVYIFLLASFSDLRDIFCLGLLLVF